MKRERGHISQRMKTKAQHHQTRFTTNAKGISLGGQKKVITKNKETMTWKSSLIKANIQWRQQMNYKKRPVRVQRRVGAGITGDNGWVWGQTRVRGCWMLFRGTYTILLVVGTFESKVMSSHFHLRKLTQAQDTSWNEAGRDTKGTLQRKLCKKRARCSRL